MSYTVGQVAGFAGVTVRTLHHYDRTGLLTPSERSAGGYRLYGDADLARLQQILFYRELGFALGEIAEILTDPQAGALDLLRARRRALRAQIDRLERLVEVADRAMKVQQTGVRLTPPERFEVFGEITFDLSYATEAEAKWEGSAGHEEAMARAAAHSQEDWARLMDEAAAWRERLLAAFDADEPADGQRARALADEHRRHISRWFTDCPPDMHLRIADDFVTDARAFALVVPPSQQRPGLARYLWEAVRANADVDAGAGGGAGAGVGAEIVADANARAKAKPEGESAGGARCES
ncbi:MerR family transcriptional regulator [Streptomyces flavofungini]|uniref:MerR family transcriptional regulator n=1 Tax=Streptomyces flavofungini TaxID=68200 RepID=A0ABS0X9T8_9ACTN|nr:MerR family transcriptional regulator [Streptomyces flavofungini]MBJ3809966.1 MerR family transcriptional regulator [Streptomyces flavofungini]GHC53745.1 HTH-type transcriptional activator TipA [Streptomyces flavofungini]